MVCLCEGVSERKIRKAIEHGASTVDAIASTCRAGGCCFGCHPTIESMLADARQAHPVRLSVA